MSDFLQPHGLYSQWNSPGQNTGVCSLSLLLEDLPNPGIEPRSPTLQANSLPSEPQGKPKNTGVGSLSFSRDRPNPGIEPGSPALQAESLQPGPPGKPKDRLNPPLPFCSIQALGGLGDATSRRKICFFSVHQFKC